MEKERGRKERGREGKEDHGDKTGMLCACRHAALTNEHSPLVKVSDYYMKKGKNKIENIKLYEEKQK